MTQRFLPNEADAFHANQAEPDSVDFEILLLGQRRTGVLSGCAVTESSPAAQTVDVAVGEVVETGEQISVSGQADVAVSAADGSNPRIDLISVNASGTVVVTAGTAAAQPVMPAVPATSVPLATLYVAASDNTHANNQINDKRVIVGNRYVFNVKDFGATGDGATDDTTAIQAAIDACEAANGGEVFFPNPDTLYLTTAVLTVNVDGITLRGESHRGNTNGTLIQNVTTGIFDLGSTQFLRWILVKDLRLHSAGGDAIISTFGFVKSKFENLFINATAGNSALSYDGTGASAVAFVNNLFVNCEFSAGASQTVPIIDLQTNQGDINENTWIGCVFTQNSGTITAPSLKIVHTTTSDYCYGNRFLTCTFEDPLAGAIHLESCFATVMWGVSVYDLSATTVGHLILLDNGTGNTTRSTTINGYLRAAGTLGGGLYDIQLAACENTVILTPGQVDAGTDLTINVNDQQSTRIIPLNPPNVTVLNRLSSDTAYEISGNTTPSWDHGILNVDTSGGAVVITLPDNTLFEGKQYLIRRDGASTVTIDRAGSDTFDDADVQKTLDSDSAAIGIFSIGDTEWKIVATQGTVGGS